LAFAFPDIIARARHRDKEKPQKIYATLRFFLHVPIIPAFLVILFRLFVVMPEFAGANLLS
jgi:hypothetical protein